MGFHQQIIINRIIPARPAMLLIIKQILNKLLQRHGIALWRTDKSVQERWGVVYCIYRQQYTGLKKKKKKEHYKYQMEDKAGREMTCN